MKKNTFKDPSRIKYEPVQQPKRPFWMQSVERHKRIENASGLVIIIVCLAMFIVGYLISGL